VEGQVATHARANGAVAEKSSRVAYGNAWPVAKRLQDWMRVMLCWLSLAEVAAA
jgi:hypothetical protein